MLLSAEGVSDKVPPASVQASVAIDPYRVAAKALVDMQRHRVSPTAQAYALFLAYHGGAHPGLTLRMAELLEAGEAVTPALIDELRAEFDVDGPLAGGETAGDHYLDMSESLQDAADELVKTATVGRVAIRDYSEVLANTAVQLGDEPTGRESMRVITMLTGETLKMAERNRELREQLAATSGRVEKLRRMLAEEKQASSTDKLTGLANRRAFDLRMRRTLGKIGTEACPTASLLLLDVDHFKLFNDTYGHSTGDLVLRLVSRLLVDSIKGRDSAARYGGEEFAILLVGAELDAGAHVARQICTTLANKRFKLTGAKEQGQGRVTISIGVAQLRATDTLRSVVDRADAALYAAKHAGRNRVMTEHQVDGAKAAG